MGLLKIDRCNLLFLKIDGCNCTRCTRFNRAPAKWRPMAACCAVAVLKTTLTASTPRHGGGSLRYAFLPSAHPTAATQHRLAATPATTAKQRPEAYSLTLLIDERVLVGRGVGFIQARHGKIMNEIDRSCHNKNLTKCLSKNWLS